MVELTFNGLVDKVAAIYYYAINRIWPPCHISAINISADNIVELLLKGLWFSGGLDNKTCQCIRDAWYEEGSVALKERVLKNPSLLSKLSRALAVGDLNTMYAIAGGEL